MTRHLLMKKIDIESPFVTLQFVEKYLSIGHTLARDLVGKMGSPKSTSNPLGGAIVLKNDTAGRNGFVRINKDDFIERLELMKAVK